MLKNFKFTINAWLTFICLFFLITRFWAISSDPPSLYWDEASIGYNAYSILKTGRDEWGVRFPIHFRAFGEFKLPVYIYSVTISEMIFGLTPLAVRSPAVLYSLGSLLLIYFLAKKITKNKLSGILSAGYFAVSPWYFIFSRTGYEATAGLFFFLLAIYFFLLSQSKWYFYLLSVLSLILSIYSYNSFRLLSGIVFLVATGYIILTAFNKKTLIICLVGLIIFTMSLIPIVRLLLFDAGFSRAESFSLLPNIQQVYDLQGKPHLQIIFDRSHSTDWWKNLFSIIKNYSSHFTPQFLFINGDPNPRNQQPGFGQLYWPDFPLFILGFYSLFKLRKLYFLLILFLFVIAPIPSVLFRESPHALRAILMAPVLAILIGLGGNWLSRKNKYVLLVQVIIYLVFFGFYFFNFLYTYPTRTSADWQYGYKQIYTIYNSQFSNYNNIIISDDYAQPYIFTLFYLKILPQDFQKMAQYNPINDWGFSTINHFSKFYFVKEQNPDLNSSGKSLIFMTKPLGNDLRASKIEFLNGQPAIFVYTINK